MLEAVGQFHEQPKEEKMEWYSRDQKQRVKYYCNGALLVSKAADWRDSILFEFQDGPLNPDELPLICSTNNCWKIWLNKQVLIQQYKP